MSTPPLGGKVAPVTAGSRRIGRAIAVELAGLGGPMVYAATYIDAVGFSQEHDHLRAS